MGVFFVFMALSTNTQDLEYSKFIEAGTGTPATRTYNAALDPGDDLQNDVKKVEFRYIPSYSAAVGTTTHLGTAGFLHGILLGVTSAGGNVVVYDSASGTNSSIIGVIGASAAVNFYPFNCSVSNGIVVANVGTQTYTVFYR